MGKWNSNSLRNLACTARNSLILRPLFVKFMQVLTTLYRLLGLVSEEYKWKYKEPCFSVSRANGVLVRNNCWYTEEPASEVLSEIIHGQKKPCDCSMDIMLLWVTMLQILCRFWKCASLWTRNALKAKRERPNKMQLIRCLLSNFLSQHVSGIVMPIIRRIRPCPTACGVLPGYVGCGWLWSCGAATYLNMFRASLCPSSG